MHGLSFTECALSLLDDSVSDLLRFNDGVTEHIPDVASRTPALLILILAAIVATRSSSATLLASISTLAAAILIRRLADRLSCWAVIGAGLGLGLASLASARSGCALLSPLSGAWSLCLICLFWISRRAYFCRVTFHI